MSNNSPDKIQNSQQGVNDDRMEFRHGQFDQNNNHHSEDQCTQQSHYQDETSMSNHQEENQVSQQKYQQNSPNQKSEHSMTLPSLDTPLLQFTNQQAQGKSLLFHESDDPFHSENHTPIAIHQNQHQKSHHLIDKKRTVLNFVKSRGELLEYESEYYENLRQKIIRKRRTKIIATINQNNYKTYDQVRDLYLAGVNSFLINMAYCERQFLAQLCQWRDQLEKEYNVHIPLTCVLKGSLVRIGQLSQPETYLRKGQQFRIIIKKKIVGDSNICSVDDDNLIKRIGVGAKIIIDYGQVGLTVIKKEKSDETLKYLQENFGYGHQFTRPMTEKQKRTDNFVNTSSASDADSSSKKRMSESLIKQVNQKSIPRQSVQVLPYSTNIIQTNEYEQSADNSVISSNTTTPSTRNVFADQLKQLKKNTNQKLYDVIVCTVDSDCMLKSYKPIFIYKSRDEKETLFYTKQSKQSKQLNKNHQFTDEKDSNGEEQDFDDEEYDEFSENVISAKDITDITNALNHDIDSVCVSNVRTAEDIRVVKRHCQSKQTKIIAKIQTLEGVQNYDEILKVSDAVLIARGYLTVHIPVEKLHFKQKELIQKSNESLKPVLVSCNILDSMVSSLLPTTCEVGEISNLVSDYVDAIILSGETSYGMYPIQAVETLSRICMETEARQILKNLNDTTRPIQIQWSKQSVINSIVKCTLDAAYNIQANLIIVFTSTGSTALKVSKLRPPCPIIAVTSNHKVARHINYLSSVTGKVFFTLVGTNVLTEKVLEYAKDQKYVKSGDYVIITSGEIENLSGMTNNLKIVQVQ
ncbi:pyruvate kinase complex alpha subunit (macronuclear) [Tetrahymena thermophila SB210]|uniref:Pyruvate kinase n=1 Tax=Tetrahymena thermophila (strain SB210) TaxID=312017 RepID=Q22AI0_TETTS|nr:pyruvate kinase complex alpha subunit [Tetrahymena thermophila SB210]EAR82294.2 pyruvate kinase complex alpha subunit [Tetrahymena thermophila SB210]|eukprot:XP_001029957.2 pyruvate kinase complex alpha subunit [Tetrahymena thermophila SB210]